MHEPPQSVAERESDVAKKNDPRQSPLFIRD